MSIRDISSDLFVEITKHLTLKECINLNISLHLNIPTIYLLQNSKLFYKPKLFNIDPCKLAILLKHSSLNPNTVYDVLYAIDQDLVTTQNKSMITVKYANININNEKIKNSIKLVQIMLLMLEQRFDENNIINNPYCVIYTMINSMIIDYFSDVLMAKYSVVITKQITTKFRYMIYYENSWYKSNINLYLVFLLYMINLNIISYKHLKKIRKNIRNGFDIISDVKNSNYTNIIELFNTNDAMALVHSIYSLTEYQKIIESDKVSRYMKYYVLARNSR